MQSWAITNKPKAGPYHNLGYCRVLSAATKSLSEKIDHIVEAIGLIEIQPIGALPFAAIVEQVREAEKAAEEVVQLFSEREPENKVAGQRRYQFQTFSGKLRDAREVLERAERTAGTSLMILRGNAGTGKTHLLCDVARQRLKANLPMVLFMGQRFISEDAPWPQALQQLDLVNLSAEEFVGGLESATQAAGVRALVLIDAINEGKGPQIWPTHLATFFAHLDRSPWVGVVLSIRSSYDDMVPEDLRERAVVVTHHGFGNQQYNAARTFFKHYGLELPSAPLLAPEFQNPLFLKTLCSGLQRKGIRRLPRGFHGITAMFDLYISAINDQLSSSLDFHPRKSLVGQALQKVADTFPDASQKWLTVHRAADVVDALLPGREYGRSLYRGLVVEGVLTEEPARRWSPNRENGEIVFIAYDRLADHLVTKALLDQHFDPANPTAAFEVGGGLAFLFEEEPYVAPGLLEAMCVQLPERSGQEVVDLIPTLADRWEFEEAFTQSLMWRATHTFSDRTREIVMSQLCQNAQHLHATLNALLTVATIPDHPLNADFLDTRLREDGMADRDAWWSTYLHRAWSGSGPVGRLVDWASSVKPTMDIDEKVADLCSTTLTWMLTTSNRPLRDRATKALVSLMTGRVPAAVRLVDRFSDVDDPYVLERVYAVAYGVATRSHDPSEVGALAECVYAHVFSTGTPPHILLRDYARGVVERALHLQSKIGINENRIRPPYKSTWPVIPSEKDIESFLPDPSHNPHAHDRDEIKWARNQIGYSVLEGGLHRHIAILNHLLTSAFLKE